MSTITMPGRSLLSLSSVVSYQLTSWSEVAYGMSQRSKMPLLLLNLLLPLFIDYHSDTKFQNLVLFPLRRKGIILIRFCRIDVHLVDGSHRWGMRMLSDFELPFVLLCFVFRCWLCWKQKSQITRCLFWFVQQVQCDATAGSIKEQISNMQIFSQCPTANNALRNLPAALAWLAISQGPSRKCRQHLLTSLLLSLRKAWQGFYGLCQKRGVFVKVVKVFWICPSTACIC